MIATTDNQQVSTPPAVAQNTPGFAPPEEGVLEGVLSSDSITSGGGGDELFQRSGSPAIVDDSDTNGGDGNDELQVGEESAYPTGSDPQGPEEAPDSLAKDTDEQSHPEESVGDVLGDDEGSDANTAHVPEERGNLDAAEAVSVPGTGEGWHLDSSDSAPPPGENRGDGGGFLPGTVAGLRDGGLLADDSFDRSMSFAEDDDDHHHDHDHDQTPSDILRHVSMYRVEALRLSSCRRSSSGTILCSRDFISVFDMRYVWSIQQLSSLSEWCFDFCLRVTV